MLNVLLCGGALLFIDQWTKRGAWIHAADGPLVWSRFISIRLVRSAKSTNLRDGRRGVLVLVWLASLLAALVLHFSGEWFQSTVSQVGLACAFGGAAGNLIDILRLRRVIDFIDLGWWPVFNLADVAIVCGLAVALLSES